MKHTLAEWRRLRGMSQTALAEAIGKETYQTIRRWEKGETQPRQGDLEKLRKVLGLKASDHIILPKD